MTGIHRSNPTATVIDTRPGEVRVRLNDNTDLPRWYPSVLVTTPVATVGTMLRKNQEDMVFVPEGVDLSVVGHDHDADYSDIAHNHDTDYSDIAHNHDADYSDIAHLHDANYAPRQYAYHETVGTVIDPSIGGVEGFYTDPSQGLILEASSWNNRQLLLRANTDVIASRSQVNTQVARQVRHSTQGALTDHYSTLTGPGLVQIWDAAAAIGGLEPNATYRLAVTVAFLSSWEAHSGHFEFSCVVWQGSGPSYYDYPLGTGNVELSSNPQKWMEQTLVMNLPTTADGSFVLYASLAWVDGTVKIRSSRIHASAYKL